MGGMAKDMHPCQRRDPLNQSSSHQRIQLPHPNGPAPTFHAISLPLSFRNRNTSGEQLGEQSLHEVGHFA